MTDAHSPKVLLELALETYRSEILPGLAADKRYAGAMIANAIEIAQRSMAADDREPRKQSPVGYRVLGTKYSYDPALVVRHIRQDKIRFPDAALRMLLLEMLEQELTIRNPRFLAARYAD